MTNITMYIFLDTTDDDFASKNGNISGFLSKKMKNVE